MSFLVIVKRDEQPLFSYLKEHFLEPGVTVLVDRRVGERRQGRGAAAEERRHADRRTTRSEADPLWQYGFRVAPVPAPNV